MSTLADRMLDLDTMLQHVRQVVSRGKAGDPPAFTLILGAGASYGVVPTARQMLGLPGRDGLDPKCIPAFLHERENGAPVDPSRLESCVHDFLAGRTRRPASAGRQALLNRGIAHGKAGRSAEAIADYTRVIELPGASSALVTAARLKLESIAVAEGSAVSRTEGIASKAKQDGPASPPRAKD